MHPCNSRRNWRRSKTSKSCQKVCQLVLRHRSADTSNTSGLLKKVRASAFLALRDLEWGYLDNTNHFIFQLCTMKQLNFRHVNTNSKKFFETMIYFPERSKKGSKKANIILFSMSCVKFLAILRQFQKKTSEDFRRFPKTFEDFRSHSNRSYNCQRCLNNTLNS